MSGWNGAGNYVRDYNWINDRIAGIPITASRMQPDAQDMADKGFGNCLTRDGQGGPSVDLPMGGYKHTGVGAAVARTEYAQVAQVQDGTYNFKVGGGTGDAITASITPAVVATPDGLTVTITAPGANTVTNPTFSLNSLTARTITKRGGAALIVGEYGSGQRLILSYSSTGTRWEMVNAAPSSLPPSGSAGGDLAGSYPSPTLKNIGGAGVYARATITLDNFGRVTTAVANGEPSGTLLSSGTVVPGAATILAQNLSGLSAYSRFEFQFENLTSSNSASGIFAARFSTNSGSSYIATTTYAQGGFSFSSTAQSVQGTGLTEIATIGGNVDIMTVKLSGINISSVATALLDGSISTRVQHLTGTNTATNVNAVEFFWLGSVTATGGTYRMIGYR